MLHYPLLGRIRLPDSPSSLAGLMLVLTLGVGLAEAWHGGEHEDEAHCVDCVLCDRVALSPDVDLPGVPAISDPIRISRPALSASMPDTPRVRRHDQARAPPA